MTPAITYLTSTTSLSFPTTAEIAFNRSKENLALGNKYDVTMTFRVLSVCRNTNLTQNKFALLAPASIHSLAFCSFIPPPICNPPANQSTASAKKRKKCRIAIVGITRPSSESLFRSIVVPRSKSDNVSTQEVSFLVHFRKFRRPLADKVSSSFRGMTQEGKRKACLVVKLVFNSSGLLSDKVPPTICLTCPLCKSIHGRKML
jgi:hypothetical protein